jgi:hypothetical protein
MVGSLAKIGSDSVLSFERTSLGEMGLCPSPLIKFIFDT